MRLDHDATRLWADHGPAFTHALAATASARITGATTMITRNMEHLRRLSLAIAALVAAGGSIGLAVLPAIPGLA